MSGLQNQAAQLCQKAALALSHDQIQRAMELYANAAILDPQNKFPLVNLVVLQLDLQRRAEAENTIKKIFQIDPHDGVAHSILGRLFLQDHKPTDCLKEIELAIQSKQLGEEEIRDLLWIKAEALSDLGQTTDSKAILLKIVQEDPEHANSRISMIKILEAEHAWESTVRLCEEFFDTVQELDEEIVSIRSRALEKMGAAITPYEVKPRKKDTMGVDTSRTSNNNNSSPLTQEEEEEEYYPMASSHLRNINFSKQGAQVEEKACNLPDFSAHKPPSILSEPSSQIANVPNFITDFNTIYDFFPANEVPELLKHKSVMSKSSENFAQATKPNNKLSSLASQNISQVVETLYAQTPTENKKAFPKKVKAITRLEKKVFLEVSEDEHLLEELAQLLARLFSSEVLTDCDVDENKLSISLVLSSQARILEKILEIFLSGKEQ